MKLWMDIQRDLEGVMYDHERILDAWKEGGVDGVVFGPLVFGTAKLSQKAQSLPSDELVAPVYDPNPAVYRRLGVEAPPPPEHMLAEKRALLEKTLTATKDRGMQVYFMYADGGAGPGGPGHHLHDDRTLATRVATKLADLRGVRQLAVGHGSRYDQISQGKGVALARAGTPRRSSRNVCHQRNSSGSWS